MFWKYIFKRKRLFKIVYEKIGRYTTIIEARDEYHALRKFHRKMEYGIEPSIISIEEYWI
jgi:hypothetical protein